MNSAEVQRTTSLLAASLRELQTRITSEQAGMAWRPESRQAGCIRSGQSLPPPSHGCASVPDKSWWCPRRQPKQLSQGAFLQQAGGSSLCNGAAPSCLCCSAACSARGSGTRSILPVAQHAGLGLGARHCHLGSSRGVHPPHARALHAPQPLHAHVNAVACRELAVLETPTVAVWRQAIHHRICVRCKPCPIPYERAARLAE